MFDTFSEKILVSCKTRKKTPKVFRGPLILFEGTDLSGKSTVIKLLRNIYWDNLRVVQEPTSRSSLKEIIFDSKQLFDDVDIYSDIEDYINYYLIMASRAYSLYIAFEEMFKKRIVALDRSFISTCVYQTGSFDIDKIISDNMLLYREISNKFDFYDKIYAPDLIFFLDINYETYVNRIDRLNQESNKFDSYNKSVIMFRIGKYRSVIDYLIRTNILNTKIVIINGDQNIDLVFKEIASNIYSYLSGIKFQ